MKARVKDKKENIMPLTAPSYYSRFRCVGAECPIDCCNGRRWAIYIDKDTYDKYQRVTDPEFCEMRDKYIRVNETDSSEAKYAFIVPETAEVLFNGNVIRSTVNCGFQCEDKLCYIQKKFGSDHLSRTCADYPRGSVIIVSKEFFLTHMTMSCPVIQQMSLFSGKEFKLTIQTERYGGDNSRLHASMMFTPKFEHHTQEILTSYKDVLDSCLMIANKGNAKIDDRIVTLGLLARKISEYLQQSPVVTAADISMTALQFALDFSQGGYAGLVESAPHNPELERNWHKAALEFLALVNSKHSHFSALHIRENIEEILTSDGKDDISIMKKAREVISRRWGDFLDNHPYFAEHHLSYFILSLMFPYCVGNSYTIGDGENRFIKSAVLMAAKYAVTRYILSACAEIYDGAIPEEVITSAVTAIETSFAHGADDINKMFGFFKSHGLDRIEYLPFMLK